MSIGATIPRNDYLGNGAVSAYDYTFYIRDESHLRVIKRLISTGAETELVLNSDYTVSGVGEAGGGSITLSAGNLAATYSLTILSARPNSQDYNIGGTTGRQSIEDSVDDLAIISQQLQEQVDRAVKLPASISPDDIDPNVSGLLDDDYALLIGPSGATLGPSLTDLNAAISGTSGAAASATAAAASATAASGSATSAATSATAAAASASAAASSATDAEAAQTAAETAMGTASGYATTAETYKDQAETAATNAAASLAAFADFRSDPGVPDDAVGQDGDHYLDQTSRYLYKRESGVYSVVAVLAGGGGGGNIVIFGSAAPSNGAGVDGDTYIRTSNGAFYSKSGGVWSLEYTDNAPVTTVNGRSGAIVLDKTDVGLGNVDNTSDLAKPISTLTQAGLDLKADVNSPTFTGNPTAPTPAPGDNTTSLATTAFVTDALAGVGGNWGSIGGTLSDQTDLQAALDAKADLASPALTGVPTAPTATAGTNTTQIATTAYVEAAVAAAPGGVTSVFGRTGDVVATSGDYVASDIPFDFGGGLSSANVQDALVELDTEKAPLASPTFTGTPAGPTAAAGTSTTQLATTDFVAKEVSRGRNFLTAVDGSAIGSIAAYADSGAAPTDGTGGSPNSTIAVSTDSSLVGSSNFLWTKSGSASRQGEGWSQAFTIDSAYQAKPCTFSALYKIASGTYADGDMTVWIYDVTNGVLIQPTGYSIQNVSGVGQIKAEFQTSYNSTSYRLIIHTASTSTADYTIRFDALSISPNTYSYGASVTDWSSTPAPSGSVTNATRSQYFARRNGGNVEVQTTLLFSGAGNLTTLPAAAILPSGLSVDTSRLAYVASSPNYAAVGRAYALDSGTADYALQVLYSQVNNTFSVVTQANAGPFTPGNLDQATLVISVPILGWGTSQVLSSETDTRVVSLSGSTTDNFGSPSLSIAGIQSMQEDSHGGYNSTTKLYTIPVAGYYDIEAEIAGSNGGNFNGSIAIYIDGVSVKSSTVGTATTTQQIQFRTSYGKQLRAGQTVSFYVACSSGTMTTASSEFKIRRLSGPAQIAASEKVYCQYTGNGATSVTASTTNITWSTKVSDSHGAWNGAQFTAPRASWYDVRGNCYFSTAAARSIFLYVDGVVKYDMGGGVSSNSPNFMGGTYLNAGQVLSIRSDTSGTLANDATVHCIAITSQG